MTTPQSAARSRGVRCRSRRRGLGIVATTAVLWGVAVAAPSPAGAEPRTPPPSSGSSAARSEPQQHMYLPGPAVIDHIEPITERWLRVYVSSPAMGRLVQVQVLLPADRSTPRPTVYMLDGRNAEEGNNGWSQHGGAVGFFAEKNVNVVLTTGGAASYYTDWQHRDRVLGTNKWETFLTRELPPLIDAHFDGNGRNAIEGTSMGAEAAMMLATRTPGLYKAVAAHSGCYLLSTGFGQTQARAIVQTWGGDPDNMFGRHDDPDWAAHDPTVNAAALRGTAIYLSTGSGLPGEHEVAGNPELHDAITVGGPLESGTDACTRRFADRLTQLSIPATTNFRPTGTHSWPYWADELHRSWPTITTALTNKN
ncbi:alpha/beta hydrolase [Nocardia sp. SC052]|uniref:alpha/beta hydrolase n=1 Tax=Nocardia sichangensis TaxID=3385975 RepID=UPI00399FA387